MTDVPFGLRLFVWLTESFGRLAATTVVVGATLTTLELGALVALVVLVVLATEVVVSEIELFAATVVGAAIDATIDGIVSTASIVVVTVVTNVSLAD